MPPPVPKPLPKYGDRLNFQELAKQDPEFAELLKSNDGKMDWQNGRFMKLLTNLVLKRDFGLSVQLPDDRLCPPVPIRYAYITWLQSLIDSTSPSYSDSYILNRQIIGLDIGAGASCIYPLLGTVTRPNWRFFGTDADEKSFAFAQRNVTSNDLESRIRLRKVSRQDPLIPLDALGTRRLDFTMCNPPFYASREDMQSSTSLKGAPPSAVCTGADIEMITEGGDAGFATRMIGESSTLRARVQWYTCMMCKLSSLATVVAALRDAGCRNWAVGTLAESGRTRRWVVGWSWADFRPRNDVARGQVPQKDILPFPTEMAVSNYGRGKEATAETVDGIMKELNLVWMWKPERSAGMALAKSNVWSRAARRKKMRDVESGAMDVDSTSDEDSEVALCVKITVRPKNVTIRWLRGQDHTIFESFCTMVKRKLFSASGSGPETRMEQS